MDNERKIHSDKLLRKETNLENILKETMRKIDFILSQKYLSEFPINDFNFEVFYDSVQDCMGSEGNAEKLNAIISVLIEISINYEINSDKPQETAELNLLLQQFLWGDAADLVIKNN